MNNCQQQRDNQAHIEALFDDNRLIEVRCQDAASGKWSSGVFNGPDPLRCVVRPLIGSSHVYTTINRPIELPTTNILRPAISGGATSDAQIERITRLPFDFDPARPSGVCSTDAELAAARETLKRARRYFYAIEWPEPLIAQSGNGWHLQFRCTMPNDDETREQLAAIYNGLAQQLGDETTGFDTTVRNPSRIFRLYGTTNCKGPNTAGRPHRLASCTVPSRWDTVSRAQIDRLAAKLRPAVEQKREVRRERAKVSGQGDYRTLDLAALFRSHGLYKRELHGGKHSVTCPWSHEHSSPDNPRSSETVVFARGNSGYPNFHCSHAHCNGRGLFEVTRELPGADRFCSQDYSREVAL